MRVRWPSTVFSERNSSAPISRFVRPSATSSAISRSRPDERVEALAAAAALAGGDALAEAAQLARGLVAVAGGAERGQLGLRALELGDAAPRAARRRPAPPRRACGSGRRPAARRPTRRARPRRSASFAAASGSPARRRSRGARVQHATPRRAAARARQHALVAALRPRVRPPSRSPRASSARASAAYSQARRPGSIDGKSGIADGRNGARQRSTSPMSTHITPRWACVRAREHAVVEPLEQRHRLVAGGPRAVDVAEHRPPSSASATEREADQLPVAGQPRRLERRVGRLGRLGEPPAGLQRVREPDQHRHDELALADRAREVDPAAQVADRVVVALAEVLGEAEVVRRVEPQHQLIVGQRVEQRRALRAGGLAPPPRVAEVVLGEAQQRGGERLQPAVLQRPRGLGGARRPTRASPRSRCRTARRRPARRAARRPRRRPGPRARRAPQQPRVGGVVAAEQVLAAAQAAISRTRRSASSTSASASTSVSSARSSRPVAASAPASGTSSPSRRPGSLVARAEQPQRGLEPARGDRRRARGGLVAGLLEHAAAASSPTRAALDVVRARGERPRPRGERRGGARVRLQPPRLAGRLVDRAAHERVAEAVAARDVGRPERAPAASSSSIAASALALVNARRRRPRGRGRTARRPRRRPSASRRAGSARPAISWPSAAATAGGTPTSAVGRAGGGPAAGARAPRGRTGCRRSGRTAARLAPRARRAARPPRLRQRAEPELGRRSPSRPAASSAASRLSATCPARNASAISTGAGGGRRSRWAISSSEASSAQCTSSSISTTGVAHRHPLQQRARPRGRRGSARPAGRRAGRPARPTAARARARRRARRSAPRAGARRAHATWSSSASTQIANGSSHSSSAPRPTNTGCRRSPARSASSLSSRVLPIPGSPLRATKVGLPRPRPSRAAASTVDSWRRPTRRPRPAPLVPIATPVTLRPRMR